MDTKETPTECAGETIHLTKEEQDLWNMIPYIAVSGGALTYTKLDCEGVDYSFGGVAQKGKLHSV